LVRIDDLGETELPLGPGWQLIDEDDRVWGTTFSGDNEQIVFKTRFGPTQNLGAFGADGADIICVNRNGDFGGLTYSNSTSFPPTTAFAVVDGVEHFVTSETGNDARTLAVTLDGQIIGTDRGLCTPECDGKVWVIKDGVRHNLDDEISAVLGFFPTLWGARAASETGWIIGEATDPRTNTFHFFRLKIQVNIDTDGDGLLDFWESENGGIDSNQDGTIDFKPYDLGARPDHKDLFIEVDAGTVPLGDNETSKVIFAFDNAPVENPDGTTGVRLHILRDETSLPLPDAVVFGTRLPEGFASSKASHFGTPAERADPNAVNILKAKERVFRYSIIYDGLQFVGSSGRYNGIAEIGGNDFIVDFLQPVFTDGFRDEDDRAATFMHELGHTLGLRHGGRSEKPDGSSNQGKPNYPSIMNYALAHPMRFSQKFWTLDYCREELGTLSEQFIDESAGIASSLYRGYSMPFGLGPEAARSMRLVKLDGRPTDFDGDGNRFGGISADLNFLPSSAGIAGTASPSPSDTLNGHNDWAALEYKVVTDDRQTDFDISLADGCPSSESVAVLNAILPTFCDADFNADGFLTFEDFDEFVVAFETGCDTGGGGALADPACLADFNGDGFLTFEDFDEFVTAFEAGC
jgi:hypothetical protein